MWQWLNRVFARTTRPDPAEAYNPAASRYAAWQWGLLGQYEEQVEEGTALNYSAVWGCIRVISQTIAALDWAVLQKEEKTTRSLSYEEEPVSWLLDWQASPETDAFTFREVLLKDALLSGNGYAEIEKDAFGRVQWLWRLCPSRVEVIRDEQGKLVYRIDKEQLLPPDRIYHLKGLTHDGIVGISVVENAKRSITLGKRIEQYGEQFFGRGPLPGGILKLPAGVKEAERENARKGFQQVYGGSRNAGKVIVLTAGMEFSPAGLPNSDSQFLESRSFQISEICRWFGVPPHKLAELDRATWGNIEEQNIDFVQSCLMPWCKRLENEANLKLFGRVNRGKRYTQLDLRSLTKGNSTTQVENASKLVTNGILTIDEARQELGYDPIEYGDTLLIQGAMTTVESLVEPPEPQPSPFAPEPATPAEGEEGEGDTQEEEEASPNAASAE